MELKLNLPTSLKPRGFQHWGRKLGLGNRLEIQALQWSKPAILAISKAERTASLKLAIENRISSLQESPYRFSEDFNRAIAITAKTYRRTFGLIAALASFPGIADHIIDKRIVAPHDLLIIGVPVIATFVIGHFVRNAAIERTIAVQELKKSEAYFRYVFDENPTAQHILDKSGNIEKVNRRWVGMLDYTLSEAAQHLIGKSYFENLVPETEKENALARFRGTISGSKRPERNGARNLIKNGGGQIPVRTKDTILHDDSGGVIGVLTSVDDLTILKQRSKAELLKSGAAVAKSVIDKINQKFQALSSVAMMLQRNIARLYEMVEAGGKDIKPEDIEKLANWAGQIEKIANEVTKITDLVRNYENLIQRIQGNNLDKATRLKINVASAVETAKNLALHEVGKTNAELKVTSEDDLPEIGTRTNFTDAFYYIIRNSLVPDTDAGVRHVAVDIAKKGDGIRVLITDDRLRPEPLTMERLEEPAFKHGITYLYLEYLELQIALLNLNIAGGSLAIRTTSGTEGSAKEETTFEIYLPLKQGD